MKLQWYPGHMTKAVRMMQENIKLIDLMIEILDARIPISSQNPDIDELAKGKIRLVILNKADLADDNITNSWIDYFKSKGIYAIKNDSRNNNATKKIVNDIMNCCSEKIERDRKRRIVNRPIRAMIAGIPNVGKSTFINALTGKASAKTGNKPGVTKGKQWIKLSKSLELLDTPGILWPRFEDEMTGEHIAYIGSMNDEIINIEEIACNLIKNIIEMKPGIIAERFKTDEDKEAYEILKDIAKVRGCLIKGGEYNTEKAADILLDDFRSGKLSRISLEKPEQ